MSDDLFKSLPDEDDGNIPIITSASDFPTVYADGCIFATRLGSVVRMSFFETVLEPPGGVAPGLKHRHVGTLAMPLEGYESMLRYLNDVTPKWILPPADLDSGGE